MSRKKPITVAGAGLSGLTAAINLAKAGQAVKVYEKKGFIGQSEHETPQLLPNWFRKMDVLEELEACNIEVDWRRRLRKIEIHLPKGRILFYGRQAPVGYTVLRGGSSSFERDLARQAEEAGVEIIVGREKEEADILATGESVLLTVGLGRIVKGDFDPSVCHVFFNPAVSPSLGYGYLFPHSPSRATVKVSRRKREKVDLESRLKRLEEECPEARDNRGGLHTFSTARHFKRTESATNGGSLLVGEAAGFQDELFRFGMR